MSGFFDRLLARSTDEVPAVRPRIDPWEPPDAMDTEPWGEVVDEVAAPVVHRRARSPEPVARLVHADAPEVPAAASPSLARDGIAARFRDGEGSHAVAEPTAAPPPGSSDGPGAVPIARPARPTSRATERRAPSEPAAELPSVPRRPRSARPAAGAPEPTAATDTARPDPAPLPSLAAPFPHAMAPPPHRAPAAFAVASEATPRAPDVVISIGRIEVRAVPTAAARPATPPPDTTRLDRYLEARTGRAAR
jgi:hypothetical protein